MVTRFEAVKIGWEIVQAEGFEPSAEGFSEGNPNATVTKLIHEVYDDRGLERMSPTEAQRTLDRELRVE